MSLAVEADSVVKIYGNGSRALNNLSLSAPRKEVLGLLGRNGAGKTTFTKIVSTIMKPTSGSVNVLGYELEKGLSEIRKRISIVPQEARPYGLQTPYEHVVMYLAVRGWSLSDAKTRARQVMEELDFEKYANKITTTLSGGLKQRAMIAMAIAPRPELLLLDEPTIGLDPVARMKIWDVVRTMVREGTTIFLTTHYMDEAEALSNKVVIIDNGVKIAEGTPLELKSMVGATTTVVVSGRHEDLRFRDYGRVVGNGSTVRVFTDEQSGKRLVEEALDKNMVATVRPVNLEDVFISLVGGDAANEE
ncbi:MAG: ABC transporter ATP-binding protein [Thermoprotei archaeon]